jgi:integrase
MARPSKTAPIDYKGPNDLTHGLLERAACPDSLPFVLVRDADKKGLRLRVTKAGGKYWQFETRTKGKLFTRALGEWPAVSIEQARTEAHRLRGITQTGKDPRELERKQQEAEATEKAELAAKVAQQAEQEAARAATVGEAWQVYLAERRPFWGDKHYQDHVKLTHAGGEIRKRTKGAKTIAGPLAHFMGMRLADLDNAAVHAWAQKEAKARRARASLSLRLLKAFLRWCAAEDAYKAVTDPTAASGKKTREVIGTAKVGNDCLQREQLATWFTHVRQIQNPVIGAYLQCLLLTGARREELGELKWEDVNFQWNGISMKDKIEGNRPVPLTPYVSHLLQSLPKCNQWVFSSVKVVSMDEKHIARRAAYQAKHGTSKPNNNNRSESGRLVEPSIAHRKACAAAGLRGLTLQGLRRSFASLCEWLDIPGGISAQIQGHAPQGVREQNYIRRPLDLLRVHHEKIEAWILEQAGVAFIAQAETGKLQLVA